MIIKNFKELAKTEERKLVLEMLDAGLDSIDTKKVIRNTIHKDGDKLNIGGEEFSLKEIKNLFVVGVGKCALDAAMELEDILGNSIKAGIVVDVRGGKGLRRLRMMQGDHPLPSERNVKATSEIIKLLSGVTEKDLVIFIISGGGSTLLCQPENLKPEEEGNILQCLFQVGADIKEINTIRKHISKARGGRLAEYAYPARAVSLIFSDVPGDNLEFIASGPTVRDTTTIKDAKNVMAKYNIEEESGLDNVKLMETPKDDKYFKNVKNILVVSNRIALEVMAKYAESAGYKAEIRTANMSGEARSVAVDIMDDLHKQEGHKAVLYGGETTVTIKYLGMGGRNTELAIAALLQVREGETLAAMTSDGRDNTELAGAICDMITKEIAHKLNLDAAEHLEHNHSYAFFEAEGDYIKTGDTGRNVSDFVIAIKK